MPPRLTASVRDLRILAGIVSERRADLPAHGLPLSLLSDLKDQLRCDAISFEGFDSGRQQALFGESIPEDDDSTYKELEAVHWKHYWDCQPCSYPDRTGDLRTIIKIADFYSSRQWHTPAPAPGIPRRRTPPPPRARANPPATTATGPARRRAHQRPDRPAARPFRRHRPHAPAKPLPPPAGHQPHGGSHSRAPRPEAVHLNHAPRPIVQSVDAEPRPRAQIGMARAGVRAPPASRITLAPGRRAQAENAR